MRRYRLLTEHLRRRCSLLDRQLIPNIRIHRMMKLLIHLAALDVGAVLSYLPVLEEHGAVYGRPSEFRAALFARRLRLVHFELRLGEEESDHALLVVDSLLELLDFLRVQVCFLVVREEGGLGEDEVLFDLLGLLPISL